MAWTFENHLGLEDDHVVLFCILPGGIEKGDNTKVAIAVGESVLQPASGLLYIFHSCSAMFTGF